MTEIKPVGATVPPTQEFNTPATFLPNLNYGIGLGEKDSYSATALAEVLDRVSHASLAKLTLGLSPASLVGAYLDWAAHLATLLASGYSLRIRRGGKLCGCSSMRGVAQLA